MKSVCLYFQVHQPFRMRKYSVFDIGKKKSYFDDEKNSAIIKRVAEKCYLPTNTLLLNAIRAHKGAFKASFSISGTALEQLKEHAPLVIESFQALAKTNCVEFLAETYHHSLASLHSEKEFAAQVQLHKGKIEKVFGVTPTVFRNTELIYTNKIAAFAQEQGFKGILAEGADKILDGRSPNVVYKPPRKSIAVLLKNYKLSDDIAFRFSDKQWNEHPLTIAKFVSWLKETDGETVNLFMDYETFGEHQWQDTGIFTFLKELPTACLANGITFKTLAEEAAQSPVAIFDAQTPISWADVERDVSAWQGNAMQQAALRELYALESEVKKQNNPALLENWRKLQTSDHFYYMCTKWFADGDVHKYFNPYETPYDSFITFMNILNDFQIHLRAQKQKKSRIRALFTRASSAEETTNPHSFNDAVMQ